MFILMLLWCVKCTESEEWSIGRDSGLADFLNITPSKQHLILSSTVDFFLFPPSFIVVWLTNKNYMYLRRPVWCLDLHIHCEVTTIIKLFACPSSHSYLCFFGSMNISGLRYYHTLLANCKYTQYYQLLTTVTMLYIN